MTNNDAYFDLDPAAGGRRMIAIIGAGASGLACAVSCAQALEAACLRDAARIVVLESSRKPAHSILASGNGRCNFSNARIYGGLGQVRGGADMAAGACMGAGEASASMGAGVFPGASDLAGLPSAAACGYRNAAFVDEVREAAAFRGLPTAVEWLTGLGLVWEEKPHSGGLLYPFSNKSRTVADVLLHACRRHGVQVLQGVDVERVAEVSERRLAISGSVERIDQATSENGQMSRKRKSAKGGGRRQARQLDPFVLECDAAVVAVGKAVRDRRLLHGLLPGQRTVPTHMVLGPLLTGRAPIQGLDGVRMQACMSLPERGFAEDGEVLFRAYGISGIVAFNASRHAQPGDRMLVDLAPGWDVGQLERLLDARAASLALSQRASCAEGPRVGAGTPMRPRLSDVLVGMVDPPVAVALCRMAGEAPADVATPARCHGVAQAFKEFALTCEGVAEDQPCQVMRGGCAVECVDPLTLESRTLSGLYVLGEALDVDAPCGGFNLDWAWTCGIVAGNAIASSVVQGVVSEDARAHAAVGVESVEEPTEEPDERPAERSRL